jgi:putative membrane protein
MRLILLPAAVAAAVVSCGPSSRDTSRADNRETGMAGTVGDSAGAPARSIDTAHTPDTAHMGGATASKSSAASAMLSQLEVANTAEIKDGELALKHSRNQSIREFAQRLVKDHRQSREEGRKLAKNLKVDLSQVAGGATESQSAAAGELAGKSGKDFDRAFVDQQVQAHQQNIDKIQSQMLPQAQDAQLKAYLQKTVTVMQGHLASAKVLQNDLKNAS